METCVSFTILNILTMSYLLFLLEPVPNTLIDNIHSRKCKKKPIIRLKNNSSTGLDEIYTLLPKNLYIIMTTSFNDSRIWGMRKTAAIYKKR